MIGDSEDRSPAASFLRFSDVTLLLFSSEVILRHSLVSMLDEAIW